MSSAVKRALGIARRQAKKYADGGRDPIGSLINRDKIDEFADNIRRRAYPPEVLPEGRGGPPSAAYNDDMVYEPESISQNFGKVPWWSASKTFADGGEVDPEDEARAFADRPEPESWEPPDLYVPERPPAPPPPVSARETAARISAHTQGRPPQVERPVGTGEQSVTEYHPTLRENLGAYLLGDHPSQHRRRLVQEGIGSTGLGEKLSLSDLTPVGWGLAAQEHAQRGEYPEAAISVMPGAAAKAGVPVLSALKTAEPAFDPVRRQVLGGIGASIAAQAIPDFIPSVTGSMTRAAVRAGLPSGIEKLVSGGPDAVMSRAQYIANTLVREYGERHSLISEALNNIGARVGPEASDAVFGSLPTKHALGVIDHDDAQFAKLGKSHPKDYEEGTKNWEDDFEEMKGAEPSVGPTGVGAAARAESKAERAFNEDHQQFLEQKLEDKAERQFHEEHQHRFPEAYEQPRFREITHPEEAKDWLRDHGHNPDDWGYSDPENYVELANRLKKEEMGLKPPTSQTPASPVSQRRPVAEEDFAELKDDLKIAEAEFNAGKGISDPDLEHLFQTMGASDVGSFPDELMTEIRKTLSRHPNPERLRAEDEGLWNAIHQRFDDMDQRLDERIGWAGEPRREPPEPTATQTHAGPFAYTTEWGTPQSERDVNRLNTYFNETMRSRTGNRSPLFKDQEEFAKDYFGGMNTNRVTAIIASDPHGSNSPAFRFQGALLNPNNREFVAEIDRYIIPEQKYAYHGLLSVEPKYQSGEFAPQMLRNQIDLYKQLDLNYVSLGAGLDSGPYTWLKYGWIPNQHGWDTIRQRTLNYLNGGQLKVSNKEVREGLNKILSDRDPRSAWDLADVTATDDFGNEIGRTVFLGYKTRNSRNIRFDAQGWRGQLNLKNNESMERFDAFFRRQTEKKAGKAKPKSE